MTDIAELMIKSIDAYNRRDNEESAGYAREVLVARTDGDCRTEYVDACRIMANISKACSDLVGHGEWTLKVLLMVPERGEAYSNYALFIHEQGRSVEASRWHQRSVLVSPENGLYHEYLRQCMIDGWLVASFGRSVGREASKTYASKLQSGFFRRYFPGKNILDIGNGSGGNVIVEGAIGIDLGYPGYDGLHLPFDDGSQDAVYSSHCLEHVNDPVETLREWFRVIRTGGYLVMSVPHQFLYEKRVAPPSKWSGYHLHFFTPAKLLKVVEEALPPNHYRIRHFMDNDFSYDYSISPASHGAGCYEIEMVLEKIPPPDWELQD